MLSHSRHPGERVLAYDHANQAAARFWTSVASAIADRPVDSIERTRPRSPRPGTWLRFPVQRSRHLLIATLALKLARPRSPRPEHPVRRADLAPPNDQQASLSPHGMGHGREPSLHTYPSGPATAPSGHGSLL